MDTKKCHELQARTKQTMETGAETGITVHGSSNVEIINTTIDSNSGNGIYADRNSSVYLGGDNTITNNGGYAVELKTGSTLSNKCSKSNNISSNSEGVFSVTWGSEASLCNMTLSSNGVIINAVNNSTVKITDSSLTSSSGMPSNKFRNASLTTVSWLTPSSPETASAIILRKRFSSSGLVSPFDVVTWMTSFLDVFLDFFSCCCSFSFFQENKQR